MQYYSTMWMVTIFHVLTWFVFLTDGTDILTFEFEEFAVAQKYPSCRIKPRSNASNQKTVLLYEGESLHIDLCVTGRHEVSVKHLTYSNDGPSDIISIIADGKTLDSIITNNETNFGYDWNIFHKSRTVGERQTIDDGRFTLIIRALSTDPYGLELDYLTLEFSNKVSVDEILCKETETQEATHTASYLCSRKDRPDTADNATTTDTATTMTPTSSSVSTTAAVPVRSETVVFQGDSGVISLRRATKFVCQEEMAKFLVTSRDTNILYVSTLHRTSIIAPVHPSFALSNTPDFTESRPSVLIEGFSGRGKNMWVVIDEKDTEVSVIVISVPVPSFGQMSPKLIFYQDGHLRLFPYHPVYAQPKFYLTSPEDGQGSSGLDIDTVVVAVTDTELELKVKSGSHMTKIYLGLGDGSTRLTVMVDKESESRLLSVVTPCWLGSDPFMRLFARVGSEDFRSLFVSSDPLSGKRISMRIDEMKKK
ncbi:uncharacterized protein LOC124260241 [Haliotis rubra]|uniref:uncharacterized protein LOC124260241 n=1 Tax=Haliotis rubra TaxID=36100 RepID=UPI001EE52CA1|nr:uncharacterized protein LOC124260241 [Haliotis rubra]